jgi:DNA-binding response OmpR family regulator
MKKKILIVDDEPHIVSALSSRLTKAGYEVSIAYDAMQGVRIAHQDKPDLIILDMRMPAGGGMGVFENLKSSTHTALIPVIFITSYSNEQIKNEVLEKGAFDFISKPFDGAELMNKITKALGESNGGTSTKDQ